MTSTQDSTKVLYLDDLRIAVRETYRDATMYRFAADDSEENLIIETTGEPAAKSPAQVVRKRFDDVKGFFGDRANVITEKELTLDGCAAFDLVYELSGPAKGPARRLSITAVRLSPQGAAYKELKYCGPDPQSKAAAGSESRRARILESFRASKLADLGPAEPGYIRRYTVDSSIQAPSAWGWHGVYVLAGEAPGARMMLAAMRLTPPVRGATLPQESDRPGLMMRIRDARKRAIETKAGPATLTAYTLDPPAGSTDVKPETVVRAEVVVPGRLRVDVELRRPSGDAAELQKAELEKEVQAAVDTVSPL